MSNPFRFTVARWYKAGGTKVQKGDAICEIETDVACADVEAWKDGVLHHLARGGDHVTVGEEIARIE